MSAGDPQWLNIARELRAIAQTGLTFTADRFDRQRYERVRELAASMLALGSDVDYGDILGILRVSQNAPAHSEHQSAVPMHQRRKRQVVALVDITVEQVSV